MSHIIRGKTILPYRCTCGQTEASEFYPDRKNKCKLCILKQAKIHYKNISEIGKISLAEVQKSWRTKNLIRVRLLAAKNRAKQKGILFSLVEQDIIDLLEVQNFSCKYSGVRFAEFTDPHEKQPGDTRDVLTLDRIDSTQGYVRGNVALVTFTVNTMKNDLSEQVFLNVIETILTRYKKST